MNEKLIRETTRIMFIVLLLSLNNLGVKLLQASKQEINYLITTWQIL